MPSRSDRLSQLSTSWTLLRQAHDPSLTKAAQAHAHVEALCEAANPRVELQLRLLEDVETAKGIVQCANDEQADLIVAGSHGRSGLSGLLLGSVSSKLVTLAQVPVLVVR